MELLCLGLIRLLGDKTMCRWFARVLDRRVANFFQYYFLKTYTHTTHLHCVGTYSLHLLQYYLPICMIRNVNLGMLVTWRSGAKRRTRLGRAACRWRRVTCPWCNASSPCPRSTTTAGSDLNTRTILQLVNWWIRVQFHFSLTQRHDWVRKLFLDSPNR